MKNNNISKERRELEKRLAEHKKHIKDIEKVLQERKELEQLKKEERLARLKLEHPKFLSAMRGLKSVLGGSSKAIGDAKKKYKKWSKEHPPKRFTD